MKGRVVFGFLGGFLLAQVGGFLPGYEFKFSDVPSMQLALAQGPASHTFQGSGFQILGTQKIKRVTPPVVRRFRSAQVKQDSDPKPLPLVVTNAKKMPEITVTEKFLTQATRSDCGPLEAFKKAEKVISIQSKAIVEPVIETARQHAEPEIIPIKAEIEQPVIPVRRHNRSQAPEYQDVGLPAPVAMAQQPMQGMQPMMQQHMTMPMGQPVYYPQPMMQQPMPMVQPMMYNQQPQVAAVAMAMQAQAMAMQSQACTLMMQAQQQPMIYPVYPQYQQQYQQPMMQPAMSQQYNYPAIPANPTGMHYRGGLGKQDKINRLMHQLQEVSQTGAIGIARLLWLIDLEFEILEQLMAGHTGQFVEKAVQERNAALQQSVDVVVQAFNSIIELSTSTTDSSDPILYNYLVRKGRKQSKSIMQNKSKKDFLHNMMSSLEHYYIMVQNMQQAFGAVRR